MTGHRPRGTRCALAGAVFALGACSSGDDSAGGRTGDDADAASSPLGSLSAAPAVQAPPASVPAVVSEEVDGAAGAGDAVAPSAVALPAASPVAMVPGEAQVPEASARYRLSFEATWSAATHPAGFPDNPHFSGLTGAVHDEQVRFWEPGQLATPGIELMAETGGGGELLEEVRAAIDSGYAVAEIAGGGVPASPGVRDVDFEVTRDYPLITVVSMLAPSPDWFVGVGGLSLLGADGAGGTAFAERVEVELVLYDAGTDDGRDYASANDATEPPGIIEPVSEAAFVDGRPVVGRFVIERVR